MSKLFGCALAGALVLAVSGCSWLSPKTAGLQSVHQAYEEEFVELFLNQPTGEAECVSQASGEQPSFARTRAEIRAYRLKYGADSTEAAHLTVLDAMMHLQVGNVGLARLTVERLEQEQGRLLSQSGELTRDYLLAEYIKPLIAGWEEVCGLAAGEAGGADRLETLSRATTTLRSGLTEQKAEGELADPAADQGAIYLATTAAIFSRWAEVQRENDCIEGRGCACPEAENAQCVPLDREQVRAACAADAGSPSEVTCLSEQRRKHYDAFIAPQTERQYAMSRDLIGQFLDPPEREVALCLGTVQNEAAAGSSRFRYLLWYKQTNDWAGSAKLPCPARSGGAEAPGS